jgi:PIN domain nuclease of toxin-antitoxin system
VKLLLDTYAWVWASQAPGELGKRARAAMLAESSSLFVSAVSHLEVARLASLGLLQLTVPVRAWCRQALVELDAAVVAVDDVVALEAYALPGRFHADPADRLLVATARVHGLTLLTADERILKYPEVRAMGARK